jgi:hypothetical protein
MAVLSLQVNMEFSVTQKKKSATVLRLLSFINKTVKKK